MFYQVCLEERILEERIFEQVCVEGMFAISSMGYTDKPEVLEEYFGEPKNYAGMNFYISPGYDGNRTFCITINPGDERVQTAIIVLGEEKNKIDFLLYGWGKVLDYEMMDNSSQRDQFSLKTITWEEIIEYMPPTKELETYLNNAKATDGERATWSKLYYVGQAFAELFLGETDFAKNLALQYLNAGTSWVAGKESEIYEQRFLSEGNIDESSLRKYLTLKMEEKVKAVYDQMVPPRQVSEGAVAEDVVLPPKVLDRFTDAMGVFFLGLGYPSAVYEREVGSFRQIANYANN